jgi:hypothetical protein
MVIGMIWASHTWQLLLPKLGTQSFKLLGYAFKLGVQTAGLLSLALLLGGLLLLMTQQLSWVWLKQYCLYNIVLLYPWLVGITTLCLLLVRPVRFLGRWLLYP